MEGYVRGAWLAVDERGLKAPWRRSVRLANLFGEQALFQLRRAADRAGWGCGCGPDGPGSGSRNTALAR
jgi:hypothetical protein